MFQEAHYQDPEAAREMLESLLWPEGAVCPHCGCTGNTTKLNLKRRNGVHKCNDCRKDFTVTVGTVFERSHVPLNIWFQVVYLMCSSKKGISSHQIHRMVGVTYKTAWFMTHRIREAMDEGTLVFPLGGAGIGTFHHVGSNHLDSYLNEFDFRYNYRDKSDVERTALAMKGIAGKRLTYHDC